MSIAALSVLACGPFFPNWLLSGGDEALLVAPVANFRHELDRLTLPPRAHAAVPPSHAHDEQTREAEGADLEAAARARKSSLETLESWRTSIQTLRTTGTLSEPTTLPQEFHDYVVGAFAWSRGEKAEAKEAWQKLMKLPADERQFKSTWAVYMLGRAAETNEWQEAIGRYQEVRRLAAAGFKDSLGLAAASLGWEAQLLLRHHNFSAAMKLYLEQFASGDETAVISLRETASRALSEATEAQLVELAKQEASRRVIGAWFISSSSSWMDDLPSEEAKQPKLLRWLTAVETAGIKDVPTAEQLALAAYRAGRMDMAVRWIKRAPASPSMQWLNAKLWLRQGKVDKAAEVLSRVVNAFPVVTLHSSPDGVDEGNWAPWLLSPLYSPTAVEPDQTNALAPRSLEAGLAMTDGQSLETFAHDQALGELGVLRLARREYTQALDALLRSDFWMDAAYVAERVLETSELQSYVDREWPAMEPKPLNDPSHPVTEEERRESTHRVAIRYLLGRRLARENRADESAPYIPSDLHPHLEQFLAGMKQGADASLSAAERAAGWWQAAGVARNQGMELLGTEVEPDWAIHGGMFDAGVQRSDRERTNQWVRASADEVERATRHAPATEARFHYRFTAAALGWQAASLLPDQQDETARILCISGSWLKIRDPQTADIFYKALVNRCRKTAIGRQADAMRWFPVLDASGNPIPWEKPVVSEPPVDVMEPSDDTTPLDPLDPSPTDSTIQ